MFLGQFLIVLGLTILIAGLLSLAFAGLLVGGAACSLVGAGMMYIGVKAVLEDAGRDGD